MLIDTTLLVDHPELIKGLTEGTLRRIGGVIRDNSTGKIVKHLLEAPGLTESLMKAPLPSLLSPASSVLNLAGQAYTGVKLSQMSQTLAKVNQTLSSVLNLTQVAAAASVLNVGVSIAGFAYMGYKLHQIQKSMEAFHKAMHAGFDRIEDRLERMKGQLAYLILLTEGNLAGQRLLADELAELHRATLITKLADLYAAVLNQKRFPESVPKNLLQIVTGVRSVMSDQAVRHAPELESRVMLVVDVSTQGWAAATAIEANVLLEIGQAHEAREILAGESARFRQHSQRWAKALVADERPQLATAYRLAAPRFSQTILPERVDRIAAISPGDLGAKPEIVRQRRKDAELELEMSHAKTRGIEWDHRQIAAAEYLDGLSELADRLDSQREFAHLCEEMKCKSQDLLPGPDAKPGLHVLTPPQEEEEK